MLKKLTAEGLGKNLETFIKFCSLLAESLFILASSKPFQTPQNSQQVEKKLIVIQI